MIRILVQQHSQPSYGSSGLLIILSKVHRRIGSGNIAEPVFRTVDFRQSCRRSRKIGSDNFIKIFAPTFRQCCQKVTAHRRHWGQGISPASGVLTSKRCACALTAPGGEGLSPASGGASFQRQTAFHLLGWGQCDD